MKKILFVILLLFIILGVTVFVFIRNQTAVEQSVVQTQPTSSLNQPSETFQALTTPQINQQDPTTNETVFLEQLKELDQEIDELQLVNTELIL